jgi:hypothetical protein
LGLAGARGFDDALALAGAFGAVGFFGANGLAGAATTVGFTTGAGAGVSAGIVGTGDSTLYGASGSEGFPNRNSLIFANIMFSLLLFISDRSLIKISKDVALQHK